MADASPQHSWALEAGQAFEADINTLFVVWAASLVVLMQVMLPVQLTLAGLALVAFPASTAQDMCCGVRDDSGGLHHAHNSMHCAVIQARNLANSRRRFDNVTVHAEVNVGSLCHALRQWFRLLTSGWRYSIVSKAMICCNVTRLAQSSSPFV